MYNVDISGAKIIGVSICQVWTFELQDMKTRQMLWSWLASC